MNPPCRQPDGSDCPNRAVGCHGKCDKYREFRAECDRIKAEREKEWLGIEYAKSAIWRKRTMLKCTEAGKNALRQR